MASANVLTELSAQLSSKNKLSSSDGNVAKNSSTRSKPVPGPKPVFGDKPKADEIVASKQSPTDTSVTENGKKKKSGLFSRMKRLVKKPSKKHDNSRGIENGKYLSEKQRTKSTSDLDSRVLSNRDDRISIGSDAHSGLASGSETNDSEAKQANESHGVKKLFGRGLKIRTSWKSKFKVGKKSDISSEPVSPSGKHRTKAQSAEPARIDSSRENLANISTVFADDSFFQVSLTDNSVSGHHLEQSVVVSDISVVSETIPEHRTSAAQDKIRLAPRGRRRPTRFTSQSNVENEKKEATSTSEKVSPETKVKVVSPTEKPQLAYVEQDALKGKDMTIELNDPIKKNEDKGELADTIIIKTPDGKKPLPGKELLSATSEDEFGSWEFLSKSKSNSSLEASNNSVTRSLSSSSKKSDGSAAGKCTSKTSLEQIPKQKFGVRQQDVVEDEKTISSRKESKSEDLSNSRSKSSLLQSKDEEICSSNTRKADIKILEQTQEKSAAEPHPEVLKKVNKETGKEDVSNNAGSCDEEKLQTVFDAIVSRTKSIEDDMVKSDKPASKKEVGFNVEKKINKTQKPPLSTNISFDMDDLDDIRSTDLQPTQAQRSYSLSGSAKPAVPNAIAKSSSTDTNVSKTRKNSQDGKSSEDVKGKVPDWIAIAKEKHRRHTVDDESEEEEKSGENHSDQGEKETIDKGPPPVKDKPTFDKKTGSSKIPKPAFKSQSFKDTKSASPTSKLPTRNAKSVKATSPVSMCFVCDKPAYQHERCDIDGQITHKNCAKCSMCSRTINVGTIRVVNDKLYCGIHIRNAVS